MSAPASSLVSFPVTETRLPAAVRPSLDGGASGEFRSVLADAIGGVERLRGEANRRVEQFLTGESQEVHTVALATQRAELAFETFLQVRNKVVSAYQSIMQMQV